MALAFLASALYLFHEGSHNWGWLVFVSVLCAVTPAAQKEEPKETKPEETNFIKDIKNHINDRNN